MEDQIFSEIRVPTALVNAAQARKNIAAMAAKASGQGIRFRPHFKTHQSAAMADWFRQRGVRAITVSSARMAAYFAEHGWQDILIAFPLNLREIQAQNQLAARVNLSVLVESSEAIEALDARMKNSVNIWLKIDTGLGRAGIGWENRQEIKSLCEKALGSRHHHFSGLLTHAGQTYHASSTDEIIRLYRESNQRLIDLKRHLEAETGAGIQISVGDTPGCWLSEELGAVDEIRPGNFLLFDAMMMDLGVCQPEDIALAVACPVVAKHRARLEVVIYGGAVHLSKEHLNRGQEPVYGYAVELTAAGWHFAGRENCVISLSQEHGVVRVREDLFDRVEIGGLMGIMPVHACLAVDALGGLMDLQGKRYATMPKV